MCLQWQSQVTYGPAHLILVLITYAQKPPLSAQADVYTVNSDIFERVLFSRNFAYAKFRENKILTNGRNHCRLLI